MAPQKALRSDTAIFFFDLVLDLTGRRRSSQGTKGAAYPMLSYKGVLSATRLRTVAKS
jgi:hypothetical protein